MIPSSVLGGFILLIVNQLFKQLLHTPLFETSLMETLTYHGLGLGFVAMSLRNIAKKHDSNRKVDIFNTGVTVVATYLIQAIIGLVISVGLYYVLDSFFASGLLLPMGYGQGPGQAYNWGHNYENLYGFTNGTSFGLTIAAMGFVAASVGGVIYMLEMRKKGRFVGEMGKDAVDTDITLDDISGKNEIPLSESMDKFTVQMALVFFSYSLAFLFMKGVNAIIETGVLGNFGYNTVQPLLWGFNFLFGTVFGMLVRIVLSKLRQRGVIKREYTNNFLQNRISGFMFDIMVVASIAAIDLSAFLHTEFIIPLILICVIGAVATYCYLKLVANRIFPTYADASFLALYGMLTGTASTGVILLREIDPTFDTPASDNLVYQQPWAIVFGFPMLLLLSVAPKSVGNSFLTILLLAILLIAMNIILFRKFIFKKKKK